MPHNWGCILIINLSKFFLTWMKKMWLWQWPRWSWWGMTLKTYRSMRKAKRGKSIKCIIEFSTRSINSSWTTKSRWNRSEVIGNKSAFKDQIPGLISVGVECLGSFKFSIFNRSTLSPSNLFINTVWRTKLTFL